MSVDLTKPETKQAVKDALKEYSKTLGEIQSLKDHAKEILGAVGDLTALDKATVRKIAKFYHKQSLTEEEHQFSEFKEIYTKLIG